MAYFNYFRLNVNNDSIRGTCFEMCPKEEVQLREREKLVHVLEVMDQNRRLVKRYSRSAANANMAVPKLLRPYSVLRNTVQYLLLEVTQRTDVPTAVLYDFINDRLRAVRQDMTIQRLPPTECIHLLEPMIRFHVYYGYKLCEYPLKVYDPVLNKKYLLECLKWFLTCSDSAACSQMLEELSNNFSGLEINQKNILTCDKILMESLYILCNLDDMSPLYRYLSLPKSLKTDPRLALAYKIGLENIKGNYWILIGKLLESLCPLSYCALCLYLPTIQRQALLVMSHAYNSKTLAVPVRTLRQWLRFASDDHAAAACKHYGLTVEGSAVRFNKGHFRSDAVMLQPQKLLKSDEKFNLDTKFIFTYNLQR